MSQHDRDIMSNANQWWIDGIRSTVTGYRQVIDATVEQLSDDELHARPSTEINSVAIILRHLGGNLQSRWKDFLTTDGEKPSRDRELEFAPWEGDRDSLMSYLDEGWTRLVDAIDQITHDNLSVPIFVRGEQHSIPQAITRSVAHIAYHVGQILIVARMVHRGEWNWLTIAPGQSQAFNQRTWGTADSRSTFGQSKPER